MKIEPYEDSKLAAIVRLSLRAWEPVFESIANTMDPDVYREQHPDWRVTQRKAVDPGHAAARRTYESAGFRLFPVA